LSIVLRHFDYEFLFGVFLFLHPLQVDVFKLSLLPEVFEKVVQLLNVFFIAFQKISFSES
jgi:hypothetical protein